MYVQHHNNPWFAMGIAFLGWLLSTANVHAQPVRYSRNRVTPPLAAANAQVAQPVPQCTPEDANVARQHRRAGVDAFDVRDWRTCVAEYRVAVQRCATPEARFNLAACLDGLGQYAEALEQYETLQSGQLPAEVTIEQLRRLIDNVRSRLARPLTVTVVTPPVDPAACTANLQVDPMNCGRCGNACATEQTCNAGHCVAAGLVTPPVMVPPPPRRSHLVPVMLFASAGALVATGIPLAVIAGNDAATLCETRNRTTGCNRVASGMDPRTVQVLGWGMAGVGAAAAIAGLVIELWPRHREAVTPRGITARPTASLDHDGNPFVGLGGTF